MNSNLARTSRPNRSRRAPAPTEQGLGWIHDGRRHRVSPWPELRFEREEAPGEWVEGAMSEEALASADLGVAEARWRRYLEFAPAEARQFLGTFATGRMGALHAIARCPGLLGDLVEAPALTAFVAFHLSLRGGGEPAWAEIGAVHEREGIFGLLQWLGLPASPQTLEILRHVAAPDLPVRLLEPLRSALWEPETLWALAHEPALTDERLAAMCHALAA